MRVAARITIRLCLAIGCSLYGSLSGGQERLPPIATVAPAPPSALQHSLGAVGHEAALLRAEEPELRPCDEASEFTPWSTTEAQFQYGRLETPSFAGRGETATRILTFQHASGWKYGDNFFFIDLLNDDLQDGFNDGDVYLEWYSNFSLGKIFDRKVGCGVISDVGVLAGINYGADANVRKWLPGLRLSWNLPGFAFLNTDFMAYLDDNGGVQSGGAPAETDSFMIDVNWAFPFSFGEHDFSIEGHAEFIHQRRNEFGNRVHWWILAQPQFRYDLGKSLLNCPEKLFLGVEWQIWPNKLGDRVTDENALQLLVVWRF